MCNQRTLLSTVKIDAKIYANESPEISSILTVSISNENRIEGLNNTYVIMKGRYAWPSLSFYPYFPSESEISITSSNSSIATGEWDEEDDEEPFGIKGVNYGTAQVSLQWNKTKKKVNVYVPDPSQLTGCTGPTHNYYTVNQGAELIINISCKNYPAIIKEGTVTAKNGNATIQTISWNKKDAVINDVNYGQLINGCSLNIYGKTNGEEYFTYSADGVNRGFYVYVLGQGTSMTAKGYDLTDKTTADMPYCSAGDYDFTYDVDNNDNCKVTFQPNALITKIEYLGARKTMGDEDPASLISAGDDTDLVNPGDFCDHIGDLYDYPEVYLSKDSNCEYYFKITFGKNSAERTLRVRFKSDR